MSSSALLGLYEAIRKGLSNLNALEFGARFDASAAAEKIVNVAKDRLYAGKRGLSVAVR